MNRLHLPILLVILLTITACRSGAASFQEGLLPVLHSDAYLLPTDLLFKKELTTGSNRLPAESNSALPLQVAAQNDPSVLDGYSPRSHFYVPLPCNLREDLIPDGDSQALFLFDLSFRQHIPITVRYRNAANCGLIVRPQLPLPMDRAYALVLAQSYVWQDRLQQPAALGRLFDELRKEREDTADLERKAEPFGLRPRETRQAVDLLRQEGIPSSHILRLGIAIIRSRGGLYGPYYAMLRRYQMEDKAMVVSTKRLQPNLFRLTVRLRNPCFTSPCRLASVEGPGILSVASTETGSMIDREVLIRFPEGDARGLMWLEAPESTPKKNEQLLDLRLFARLADDSALALLMQIVPQTKDVNQRIAYTMEKNALSQMLQSYTMQDLRICAEQNKCTSKGTPTRRDLFQLCLTEGDCAASAALDAEVRSVVLPLPDGLPGAKFEDGKLPGRSRIVNSFANDLREDLLSIDLSRRQMQAKERSLAHKRVHVTENIFNATQYERLIQFLHHSDGSTTE